MDYNIITKYFAREATETEIEQLFHWIDANPENRKEFIQFKKVWALTANSNLDTHLAWEYVRDEVKSTKSVKSIRYQGLKIAAVLIFVLGLGAIIEYEISKIFASEFSYLADTRIEVPVGQMSKITLPDGSVVHLNSGTKLVYSGTFNSGARNVILEGEAFFKVAKDPEHPFTVQTKDLNFTVYGTSFNIQAYTDEKFINTTLVDGSLGVIYHNGNELFRLVPGENAHFSQETRKVNVCKVDLALYTSWKDGLITFRNEKLKDIARKMERWYNVEIIIKNPSLGEELYMGTIMKNKPVNQILDVFELTSSLRYRIIPQADKPTLIYWEPK